MTFENYEDDGSDLFGDVIGDVTGAGDDSGAGAGAEEPQGSRSASASAGDTSASVTAVEQARAERRAELQELVAAGGPSAALAQELLLIMDEREARAKADAFALARLQEAEALEAGGENLLDSEAGLDLIRSRVLAQEAERDRLVIDQAVATMRAYGDDENDIASWVAEYKSNASRATELMGDPVLRSPEEMARRKAAFAGTRNPTAESIVNYTVENEFADNPFWGNSIAIAQAEMVAIARRHAGGSE